MLGHFRRLGLEDEATSLSLRDFTYLREQNSLRDVRPEPTEACKTTEDGQRVHIVVQEVSEEEFCVLYFELIFLVEPFDQTGKEVCVDFLEAEFALQ